MKTLILLALTAGLTVFSVEPAKATTKEEILIKRIEQLSAELEASKAQTQFLSAKLQAEEAGKKLSALLAAMKAEKKCELDDKLDCKTKEVEGTNGNN